MSPRRPAATLRQVLPCFPILLGTTAAPGQDLVPPDVEYVPLEQLAVEGGEPGRVDDRVGGPEWMTARDAVPEPAESGWDLGLVLEAAYEDNIFLSSASPESDFVVSVTPRIGFIAGRDDGEGAYLKLAYRPSAVVYVENGDETRIDHRVAVEAGANGRRSGLMVSGTLERLGGATPEVGAPIDRTDHAAEARAAWRPGDKLAVELAAGTSGTDYDDRRFSDSRTTYLEAALRYAYSPKTEVVVATAAGTVEVDGAPDQDFQRATARVVWQPRDKLAIDLEAGLEHRDYGSGDDTFPVLDGRVTWTPREGTELFVAGYLREDSSAVFPGENIEVAGAKAGIAQRLGGDWTARLEAGYESARYKRVSAPGVGGRDDGIFFIRPGVDYQVTDHFRLGAYYRYERNDSNAAGFGYDANRIGVDAELDF